MEPAHITPKAQAEQLIRNLPDDATFEDMQYHLYVLEKLRKAEAAAAEGRVVSHEEARKRVAPWLES